VVLVAVWEIFYDVGVCRWAAQHHSTTAGCGVKKISNEPSKTGREVSPPPPLPVPAPEIILFSITDPCRAWPVLTKHLLYLSGNGSYKIYTVKKPK
jgi:hypothetical protein